MRELDMYLKYALDECLAGDHCERLDEDGYLSLVMAATEGWEELYDTLVNEYDFHPDWAAHSYILQDAVKGGNMNIVEKIIKLNRDRLLDPHCDEGVHLNCRIPLEYREELEPIVNYESHMMPALDRYVALGNMDIIKLLIKYGHKSDTAVPIAKKLNRKRVLKYLLEEGFEEHIAN